MFVSTIQFFYPDIKQEEVYKFSLFAFTLFFILGSYWMLRCLKDVLIYKQAFPIVFGWDADYGRRLIPTLKMITPWLVAVMVIIYTKLLDMVQKHTLFYIFCSFYAILSGLGAIVLYINQTYGPESVGMYPLAALGIATYLATESFGSLVVALFWSFAVSCNKTDEAKRAFPFILAIAQFGTVAATALGWLGGLKTWMLYTICTITITSVMMMIHQIVHKLPAEQLRSDKIEKKQKPDMLAGLRLLIIQPYLLGVFIVSTFYEIVKAIVDYQMKTQAAATPGVDFEVFVFMFGFWTNVLSFVIALLGTSYIMKKFGLRFCILFYPIIFALCLIGLYAYYQTNPSPENLLWVTFAVMITVTAASYAVNNPVKELMYIPTSSDAKFKVKGITDTVGSRGGKMVGSSIAGSFNVAGNVTASIANLMAFGTLIGLGFIGVWAIAAFYVGNKNAQLVRDNQIIE